MVSSGLINYSLGLKFRNGRVSATLSRVGLFTNTRQAGPLIHDCLRRFGMSKVGLFSPARDGDPPNAAR